MLEFFLKRDRAQIGCVIQDVMGEFPPAEFRNEFRGGFAFAGIGIGIVIGRMPDLIGADFAETQMRRKFGCYPMVRAIAHLGIIGKTIIDKVKKLVFCALFAGRETIIKTTCPINRLWRKIKVGDVDLTGNLALEQGNAVWCNMWFARGRQFLTGPPKRAIDLEICS